MKQGLEARQIQTQKLSPIQIQTIKLIELPVQELNQKVREVLESNPVLDDTSPVGEEDKDISLDELNEEDQTPSYKYRISNWGKDARPEYNTFSVQESFTQSLQRQLGFRNLSDKENQIALFIIGSLDDNGYLTRDIDSISDDLAFRLGIDAGCEEIESVLGIIQEMDPPGVGARNLRECLLLQLKNSRRDETGSVAEKILSDYFTEFSNRHFQKIISRMGISESKFKAAMARILKLNPSPGGQIDDSYSNETQQIVPDFVLEEKDGVLGFSMPRFSIPELRINRTYSDMIANAGNSRKDKETISFVKSKIDSAKWFIEALKQRQNTLTKTMQAILDFQREYFEDGDESNLKPMVLKDIAEKTGFDISTISRVVNSKYIETHFGIYPLKYFFSEGMENSDGEEISTRELKKALQECIDNEDKRKPLTDEQLVEEMKLKGYKLARRTIAKYRDQLGIPLARWRKSL